MDTVFTEFALLLAARLGPHRAPPGRMILMEPLPTPCTADRIPDATGLEAFEAAYKAAMQ
ncbi:hypothetical protein [Streptomyces vinaceus]|uniref:hypothetical protein n=1 Tax=Streptomyces vinaceus TaxID=1960 RepID=UPI0035DEF29B